MVASSKLLIAALCVKQASGAAVPEDLKKGREELRKNLRSGSAATRKMQFLWASVDESEDAEERFDPGYDDFFHIPDEAVEMHVDEGESFFTDEGEFDWDAAGHPAEEGRSSGGAMVVKATKVGKMMWDETPIMVKHAKKSDKGFKSMKGAKGRFDSKSKKGYKNAKDYYSEDYYSPSAPSEDHDHFEDTGDSFLSGAMSSSAMTYGDVFKANVEVHHSDDFFSLQARTVDEIQGRSSHFSTAASATTPSHVNSFDDDFFNDDERIVFIPRPVVTIASSAFSANPQQLIPPLVPDGSGNTLTLGTEYLFNEIMVDAQSINSQLVPVEVDGETVLFIVALDGYCDRVGPADENSVQGYCFFTYTFVDPASQLTSGSFTAQGIIVNAEVPGQMTITGGTGIMTGALGLVEILPAAVDQNINPPLLIQPPVGSDPFNGVAGWAHFFEFDVDVLFFLPELYA